MSTYRPFIDDPRDMARFEGQRFVVLRATGAIAHAHRHVRSLVEARLARTDASYPEPHVTLAGFPKGTALESVRTVVAKWAQSVAPLRLEIERAGYFPTPFQIVMLQIRKTPELLAALTGIRECAREGGLDDDGTIAASEWIFHMSLAYCSSLSGPAWAALTQFVDAVPVPAEQCVVGAAEIVAFDEGREYSGGIVALSASAAPPVAPLSQGYTPSG
jgi:hypothetical protein